MKFDKSGRPPQANAMTKTGIRFMFWISRDDHAKLVLAARTEQLSCGAIVRRLIRDFLVGQIAADNENQN